jgi:peptide chain release factor subunit 1
MATVPRPDRETLRRLADAEVGAASVLSVYVNLDPSEFATADARSSAITSAVNAASQAVEDEQRELSHDEKVALREDVELVREYLESADFAGTEGVAVFAAGHADLFETLHLPFPVDNAVVVDAAPHVAPLASSESEGDWYVALVSRADARFLRGGREGLTEEGRVSDDIHGQHDQGGWSQARYERSVDQDVKRHLERVVKALGQRHRRQPFQYLLVGGPEDAYSDFVELLGQDLSALLAGRVDGIDVEVASPDQVAEAAAPAMEEHERKQQDKLIGRLAEGLGRGERAAAGLDDVLASLNEQRVEALLLDTGLSAAGAQCPACGWIGAVTEGECPADGTDLESRPNVVDPAIERALAQDARVVRLSERPELESHGGIAAVLRF